MIDVLSPVRDRLGESPLWSVADQALWWVDIEGRALRRYDWATRNVTTWDTSERPGSIALHARGGLLAAMESGVFHLRPQADGKLESQRVASVAHPRADMRFNDGRCDRAGRFWAGTMVRDLSLAAAAGALYRFDARGLSAPLVEGLIIANGIAFSPDGHTLYLSDAHASVRRIWAFDLTPDGTPINRREFVDMNKHAGRPDGAAVDSDGCYWICAADAAQVHRFTPEGQLDRSISVPVSKPTMCSFGGPDMQSLFITSLYREPPPGEEKLAGAVFVTRPGATGIAETPFSP